VKALASSVEGKRDVIGYVFAINGKLNSADVYSSNALFRKLWPKLIEASAVEAFAEMDQAGKSDAVTTDLAKAFLHDAESAKMEVKTLRPRTKMVKRENEKNVMFEARDLNRGNAWVHRNYLAK
ncbi:MAG: ARPP-1 family domain-containing protein, partial [Blastocatellia bacterium]